MSSADLPTVIKTFNFNVVCLAALSRSRTAATTAFYQFVANALTAPPYVLQCLTTVLVIWHSDRTRERGFHGAFGGELFAIAHSGLIAERTQAGWQLVGWIILRALPPGTSRGVRCVPYR